MLGSQLCSFAGIRPDRTVFRPFQRNPASHWGLILDQVALPLDPPSPCAVQRTACAVQNVHHCGPIIDRHLPFGCQLGTRASLRRQYRWAPSGRWSWLLGATEGARLNKRPRQVQRAVGLTQPGASLRLCHPKAATLHGPETPASVRAASCMHAPGLILQA